MVNKQYQIIAKNYDLAGRASSAVKQSLKELGISRQEIKRICSASYEAEINVVIHSFGGYVDIYLENNVVQLNFFDDGPGIKNIELAMTDGYSTATQEDHRNGFGAGLGLSNIKRCSDEMILTSSCEGTTMKLTFYLRGETCTTSKKS